MGEAVVERTHNALVECLDADRAKRVAAEATHALVAKEVELRQPAERAPEHLPEDWQTSQNSEQQQVPDEDAIFDASYVPTLEALIANVVQEEGPIPLSLLGRRISALHGWQRTGRRIAERIRSSLSLVEAHTEENVVFLWSTGTHALRVPFRFETGRGIRDISRAEIAALYDQHESELSRNPDPMLELARLAGVARLSSDTRNYLNSCLQWRAGNVEM